MQNWAVGCVAQQCGRQFRHRDFSVANLAWQIRVAFSKMAWNTGSNWPGEELMMRSTSEVALCCSSASSRSCLSSAIFVSALVLDGLRRPLTFGALWRFIFVGVRRRFFMASLSAARVPIVAKLPPLRQEYQETPAASCSPQVREAASYRVRPMLWKGLGPVSCNLFMRQFNIGVGSQADTARSKRDICCDPISGHSPGRVARRRPS